MGGEREFRYDITHELLSSKQAMKTMRLTVVKTTGLAKGSATFKNTEVLYLN